MEIEDILNLPSGDELAEGFADHTDLAGLLSVVEQHIADAAAQAEAAETDDTVDAVPADVFSKLTEVHESIVAVQVARTEAAEAEAAELAADQEKKAAALALLKAAPVPETVETLSAETDEEELMVDETPAETADDVVVEDGSKSFADVNFSTNSTSADALFSANTGISGTNRNLGAGTKFETFDPLGRDQYQIGEFQVEPDAQKLARSAKAKAGDTIESRQRMNEIFSASINTLLSKGRFSGYGQTVPLVSHKWSHNDFTIKKDMKAGEQAEIVDAVLKAHKEQNYSNIDGRTQVRSALVASCGEYDNCCPIPPLDTMRRIIRCTGTFGTPWIDSMATINVENSGGLRWMTEPDWREARKAIGTVTAAQNCAGYGSSEIEGDIPEGGAPFKTEHCARTPCPTVQDICVDEIYSCVIVDNLQGRVWPELTDLFLDHVDKAWNETLEAKAASTVDAASTPVLAKNRDLDTWRNFHEQLRKVRALYQGKYCLPRSERLEIHMPEWMIDKIAVGMVNDASNGYGERLFGNADAAVVEALRQLGFEPYTFRDDVMAAGGARGIGFDMVTADDGTYCLTDFPEYEVSYIYPMNTFAFLDGGTMETGLYRDHSLNGTNDAALFRAQHCEIAHLGCESLMLVTQSDPCGKAGPVGTCDLTAIEPGDVPGGIGEAKAAVPVVDAKAAEQLLDV